MKRHLYGMMKVFAAESRIQVNGVDDVVDATVGTIVTCAIQGVCSSLIRFDKLVVFPMFPVFPFVFLSSLLFFFSH